MMPYGFAGGGYGSGMMAFGWIFGILVLVALCLSIAALWKYVTKK
ncbi:MAG: hypothetical protein G01um1014106_54 [Parcubacteria group bacterium Gr01-1014_106]|nr:MAG: hypothetical protein G01um1014106_54 [Parcubacteria group bacterium Gr01-1014_106]